MLAQKFDEKLVAALRQLGCTISSDEETAVLNEATVELFWPADRYALLLTVKAPNGLWFSCNVMSGRIARDVTENEFEDWDEDEGESEDENEKEAAS
jgi:hypothetical protein